jgi:hypothetical protein
VLALLSAFALLMAGCSKKTNTGGAANTANTTQTSNAAGNSNTAPPGMSREEMKSMADKQGQATVPDKGNFKVVYANPKNEKFVRMNESLKQSGLLEELADELNATIAIPADINITVKECGKVSASWSAQDRSINMCFELMDDMAERLRPIAKPTELETAVRDSLMFALAHEIGHGLYDLLKLPPTGRSEEAVDQLVTFVLMDSASDKGEQMALSGAMWWERLYQELARSGNDPVELDQAWAREHSFDPQRFYNVVCWIYGHSPDKYRRIVNDVLPEQRAARCPQEYGNLNNIWIAEMKPYLKDAGANAASAQAAGQPGVAK